MTAKSPGDPSHILPGPLRITFACSGQYSLNVISMSYCVTPTADVVPSVEYHSTVGRDICRPNVWITFDGCPCCAAGSSPVCCRKSPTTMHKSAQEVDATQRAAIWACLACSADARLASTIQNVTYISPAVFCLTNAG